jgi:hypothetical protein
MSSTTVKSVTFDHPFRIPGMDRDHPPGTFELRISREPLDVSWEAYHETMTLMLTSGGLVEAWNVNAAELEAALARDASAGEDSRAAHEGETPSAVAGIAVAREDVLDDLEEFYRSNNGDRWFLGTDARTGQLMILHRGNQSSGGHETQSSISDFLDLKPAGPEQVALRAILDVDTQVIAGETQH